MSDFVVLCESWNSAQRENARKVFLDTISKQDFSSPELYVFAFNVGDGNFILLKERKTAILVDAGSSSVHLCKRYIRNYFKKCLGNASIEAVIITHPDNDHINFLGMPWIKSHFSEDVVAFVGCSTDVIDRVLSRCSFKSVFYREPTENPDEQWHNYQTGKCISYEDIHRRLNKLIENCEFAFL